MYLKEKIKKTFFRPSWYHIFINPYFIARYHLAKEIRKFSKKIKNKKILDIGCGDKPYGVFFKENEYIGIDIKGGGHNEENKKVDRFYDGKLVPFENEKFDLVICTQVLEHAEDPNKLINESYRVLKLGGKLFLTMPFVWNEHEEPYDFNRFTKYQHQKVLNNNDFKIENLNKTCGIFGTCGQLISAFIFESTKINFLKIIFTIVFCFPIQLFFIFLDFIFRKSGITLDYIIVARK